MDEVFKAINDPGRRKLLDSLFERNGQTLGELTAVLPEMTRYGVMNHLKVLEEAELVVTHKQGRSKFHYLNPVPLKLVLDRWISRFAAPHVGAITDVKKRLERGETIMETPNHVYKAYINAGANEVWDAITNPEKTSQYFYGTSVDSDWSVGSKMTYFYPDGSEASTGEILSIDPPKRIEFTFHPRWDPELEAEGPAREVWSISEVGSMVELKIEIFEIGPKSLAEFKDGLPYIVSGLKSLVETGQGLPSPAG